LPVYVKVSILEACKGLVVY